MTDQLTEARAAEIWDGLCQQFIDLNPTIRFAPVQSLKDKEIVYKARYDEMIRRGWATPSDMPQGIERDMYDDEALHIAAWMDERMLMIGRLVFPSTERPLPTEAAYDLKIEPYQQVVDAGRGIRLEAVHKDIQHTLFLGLMSYAWQQVRAHGYNRVCFIAAAPILQLYETMGVYVDVLGESRLYAGERRYPCKYNLLKTVESFSNSASP